MNLHTSFCTVCKHGTTAQLLQPCIMSAVVVSRSTEELSESSGTWAALQSFWRLPGIYVAMFLVRGLCIAMFVPFFTIIGSGEYLPAFPKFWEGLTVHIGSCRVAPCP